jgi:hypothetical protein
MKWSTMMKKKTIIISLATIVGFIIVCYLGLVFIVSPYILKQIGKPYGITDFNTKTGKSAKWESDIPSIVPEFTYGKIEIAGTVMVKNKKHWNFLYKAVNADGFDKYKQDLITKGWNVRNQMSDADMLLIFEDKDNLRLAFTIDTVKKFATLQVNEK